MPFEFWVSAENFLYTGLVVKMLILGGIFTFLLHIFLHKGFNNSKKFYIIFSAILLITIAYSVKTGLDYNKYKLLYDYEQYVNYGMRENKKGIIGYDYPSYFEKTAYNRIYLVQNFRKVNLYDEEIVNDEVEFLGRDGDKFYFKSRNNISYRELGDYLEIASDIDEPIRVGSKFELKDKRFQEIGFKDESTYTFLLTYKIPKDLADKKFENPGNIEILKQDEFELGWVNPTFKNQIKRFKDDN